MRCSVSRPHGRSATYSSWQLRGGQWRLWRYRYTTDQADVLLGLRGGAALYPDRASTYASAAARIAASLTSRFFDAPNGRYAEGIDQRTLDWSQDVDAVFPQGYVPWAMGGAGEANVSAFRWLLAGQQPDGRVSVGHGDPGYALSASVLLMAAAATGSPEPTRTTAWLLRRAVDHRSGAVRDTGSVDSPAYSNIAGFALLALTAQHAASW